MIGHILMRLHAAEQQQQQQQQGKQPVQRYTICVTGDHSTPVVFGDHSHEPVPFAMAQVQQAVAAMGGREQAELRMQYMQPLQQQQQQQEQQQVSGREAAAAAGSASCRIPLPDVKKPPALQELLLQAEQQQRRRQAAAQGMAFSSRREVRNSSSEQQQQAGSTGGAAEGAVEGGFGCWLEAWPQLVLGDGVVAFDELSAARGCLGRFTGAGIMPLVKQFTGRTEVPLSAAAATC
jgi:hypothetical protein